MDSAAKRYSWVRSGMTREEVVTSLGESAKRQGAISRWEVSAHAQSHASMELQFDGERRAARISMSHAQRD